MIFQGFHTTFQERGRLGIRLKMTTQSLVRKGLSYVNCMAINFLSNRNQTR